MCINCCYAAMKCSKKLAIARSAALTRWLCGRTSWMPILSNLIYAFTAAKNSLSITFRVGVYPPVFRVEITSLNAITMAASIQKGMARTIIALRSYTYASNMYCVLLNERTGKAPVMSVYIVPVIALARVARQKHLVEHMFLLGEHVIHLGTCGDNGVVCIRCGCMLDLCRHM
jgi:hypothetical protein